LVAKELGVDWDEYNAALDELFREPDDEYER
jgi:hypothetical protein